MDFSLSYHFAPQEGSNTYFYPLPDSHTQLSSPLLIVACSDIAVGEKLRYIVATQLDATGNISPNDFNDALDKALSDCNGAAVRKLTLAFAAFHKRGCLVAQMGNSRILLLRKSGIEYDSRDQVLDIYSSKAKVEQIYDIKAGDYLAISLVEKFNAQKVLSSIFNDTDANDEQRLLNFTSTVKGSNETVDETAIVRVETVAGMNPLANIRDLNAKWFMLAFALLAAIILGGWFSFKAGLLTTTPEQATVTDTTITSPQDSELPDTIVPAVKTSIDTAVTIKVDTVKHKPHKTQEDSIKATQVETEHSKPEIEPIVPEPKEPASPPVEPSHETPGESY